MTRKNATQTAADRERWLQALSAKDEASHRSRSLLLYRLLKLSNLIETPFFSGDSARYQISMNELRVLMTLLPHVQDVSAQRFAGMTPEEMATLSRLLAGMTERLQQPAISPPEAG